MVDLLKVATQFTMRFIRKLFLIGSPILLLAIFVALIISAGIQNERWKDILGAFVEYSILILIAWILLMTYIYGSLRYTKWNIPIVTLTLLTLMLIICSGYLNDYFPKGKWILGGTILGISVFYSIHFFNKKKKGAKDIFKLIFMLINIIAISAWSSQKNRTGNC